MAKKFSDLSDLFNDSFSSQTSNASSRSPQISSPNINDQTPQSVRSGISSNDDTRTPFTPSSDTSSPLTPPSPSRQPSYVLLAELEALEKQKEIIQNQITSISGLINQARQ